MSEANLWEWLRDVALPLGQYSRIESGDTAPGFPDVHCQLGPGISPTLELKFARHPDREIPFSKVSGMRRSQIIWIRENMRSGGVVWIIAEVTPEIFIIGGQYAGIINGSTIDQLHEMAEKVLQSKRNAEYAAKFFHKLLLEDQ